MFGFIFWLITLYLNDQIYFKKEDKLRALDRSSMLTLCSEGSHGHSLEADGQGFPYLHQASPDRGGGPSGGGTGIHP